MSVVLFESSSGYALFNVSQAEEIGLGVDVVIEAMGNLAKFGKIVTLRAFRPFKSAEEGLTNINMVSEGAVSPMLKEFIESSISPSDGVTIGVFDAELGSAIKAETQIECEKNQLVSQLLRGIRTHFHKYIDGLEDGDLERAQLGLGHSYSRAKVKFNVNRVDNMIIQSIALLDQLDKDLNTFAMRAREWYSWHFPELWPVVPDNAIFCKLVGVIKDKLSVTEESLDTIEEVVGDRATAEKVLAAARSSMGMEISEIDLINVVSFCDRVASLSTYRANLTQYLHDKMQTVAPNLAELIGDTVGARLISHAGSLTSLAKYPASTVQILGAEKALFRALKTKGNTPKYGLIFHSSFIGKASTKNKGRISRYLANKCSIASRIDCFSDHPTSTFGKKLRGQVEERLAFYEGGETPRKNIEVMQEAIAEYKAEMAASGVETPKRKSADAPQPMDIDSPTSVTKSGKKKKKKKKKKKHKK